MKKYFSKEVKIAIAVIVSLAVLFWGIEYLKGINLFKPANFYYAKFDNVAGLNESAPVTINGFQVGQVREIKYDYESGALVVLLSLDKDLRVPVDSKAVVSLDLLGTAQIQLQMSQNKTYYEIGEYIPGGNAAGLMDKVGEELLPGIVQMMPKIDSILTNLNNIVASPALTASVKRLDAISANLETTSQQLANLMSGSLPKVMNNVKSVTANIDSISGDLAVVSARLREIPIDSTMMNINVTTANLSELTTKLNSKDSSLGMLINDPSLYEHLDNSVMSLDSLLIDLRKNPKRYVTFKVF